MQFRLPKSHSYWMTFPEYLIEAPGSFALMPQNRLHLILLFSINHNWWRWLLRTTELLRTDISPHVGDMENWMNLPIWGKTQLVSHWRNHPDNRKRTDPASSHF